jgi:hypothetical protein
MSDEIEEIEDDAKETGLTASDLELIGKKWLDRLRAADKREESWSKSATEAQKAYLADDCDDIPGEVPDFNILHSNVETIVPSIYNSTPKPDIRPRHGVPDAVAKQVSDIYERAISAQIDDSRLDCEIEKSAQDAFLAGRGVVRIKFDADVSEKPVLMVNPLTGAQEVVGSQTVVTGERLIYEVVPWQDYREGPAKRWSDVPWVAYRHFLSEEGVDEIEDEALTDLQGDVENEEEGETETPVWEIWCKATKRVYFITADNARVLRIADDPLNLTGFFPQPEPVQPITPTNSRKPVCPYSVYKSLAQELDTLTKRIQRIVEGLKVRGLVAGGAEDISNLAAAGDNELVTAANLESLVAAGGLDKAIMWWPLETAIAVVRELYSQREQTKQAIYEITGISDIIRGQGAASETATAQQIKTQWGSLRIKKMQRAIERQVRGVFIISAEIIAQRFSAETLAKMTGVQITPEIQPILQAPLDHYRIDVESDSTVRADLTQGRQEMAQFLQGTAQFFQTMAPVIAQAPQAAGPIVEMYSAFARQFNLGKQAEDALDQFVQMAQQAAQQPKGPDAAQEAMKAELAMKQQDMQARLGMDQQKMALDIQKAQLDVQLKQADLALKNRQLDLDEAIATTDAAARMVEIEMEDSQQRPVAFGQ